MYYWELAKKMLAGTVPLMLIETLSWNMPEWIWERICTLQVIAERMGCYYCKWSKNSSSANICLRLQICTDCLQTLLSFYLYWKRLTSSGWNISRVNTLLLRLMVHVKKKYYENCKHDGQDFWQIERVDKCHPADLLW